MYQIIMYLSIIIPVFNEQDSLKPIFSKIKNTFKSLQKPYEVIFIDDGSTDNSFDILKTLEKENSSVSLFSFRKNLGKSQGLMLGFQKAKGEFIGTLDADLQDEPQSILDLLEYLHEKKADMVNGWRTNRKDSEFKKKASKAFNNLITKVFSLSLHDINCPVKVYKWETVADLRLYGGLHRFIPLLIHNMGFKIAEKEVVNHPRLYGQSKYRSSKVLTDLPDLFTIYFLTNYAGRPLHFFGRIGAVPFLIGIIVLVYLVLVKLGGESIGTRPLLTFGVLLTLFGVQIIFTGFLADLIVNTTSKHTSTFPLKYESKN